MNRLDESLHELMKLGKQQGHLTMSQVNAYLPDEAVNPEKLANLIMVLEAVSYTHLTLPTICSV